MGSQVRILLSRPIKSMSYKMKKLLTSGFFHFGITFGITFFIIAIQAHLASHKKSSTKRHRNTICNLHPASIRACIGTVVIFKLRKIAGVQSRFSRASRTRRRRWATCVGRRPARLPPGRASAMRISFPPVAFKTL